jgi:hypothetical protein
MISQHIMFDELCFPFIALPPLTNDYEFLSKMDPVLSPIGTRQSVGTSLTTVGGPTVPLGDMTTPVAEVDGSTTPKLV